jgi:hypothetical protein
MTIVNVLDAARDHQQMVDIIHRTHQIFVGIKGKDIVLLAADPPGRTDTETFVSIPIEDPEADKIHKHEWMHIFFKSNLRARSAFAESYSESLKKRLPTLHQKGMEDFIHLLVNGLDDVRVCSLWELIYPHSAFEVQERWRRIILGSGRYQQDIIMYLMGLGLGLDGRMDRSEWMRYKSVLKDAVEKVIRRGFPTCLLAARWVIESVLADITLQHLAPPSHSVMPPKPVQFIPSAAPPEVGARLGTGIKFSGGSAPTTPEENEKQASILSKLHLGATKVAHRSAPLRDAWRMMDTDRMPTGPDPDWKGTEAMVRIAMGVSNPQQVEVVLRQSQLDVDRIISELKNRTKLLTPNQRLLKGLEATVRLRSIPPKSVDNLQLKEGDKKLVNVLKHSFMRLMDHKKRVTSDSGTTLDPQAYIDFLNGSSNTDIFVEEENSRGFSALILLDMSGSMKGKWATVSRACKVIAQSMAFPCSRLEVWGFTSIGDGTASILKFEDPERGYTGPGVTDVWGLTPLHIAVEVALRRLQALPGSAQHLLVLTDGYPTHLSANRELLTDTGDLFSEVSRHIQGGRKKGVNVAGLISGNEVNDQAATIMFGHRRFWSRVSEDQEDLFQSLVTLARKAFVGYLRSK